MYRFDTGLTERLVNLGHNDLYVLMEEFLITEKLGSDPRFQKAKEAELLIKLERWSDANKAYKNMLKDK